MDPTPRRHTEIIAGMLPLTGRRLLEVGCGDGALVGWMRRQGADAIGLESDRGQLARARAKLGPTGLLGGRGEMLPLGDSCIDGMLYFNSLHHLPLRAHREALVEAARVLVPGSDLVVIEPLAEGDYFELLRPIEDETEVRAAAQDALSAAADLGLEPVQRLDYASVVQRASVAELESLFLAADPTRRQALERSRAVLTKAFATRGEPAEGGGRRFVQPMRCVHLRRPTSGPRVAVARSAAERQAIFDIRRMVFVDEQGVSATAEIDEHDQTAEHVLIEHHGKIVGTLRWRPIDPAGYAKIERVAVLREWRGQGLARTMLRWLLARLDGFGFDEAVLHAQVQSIAVYAAVGFMVEGEPFIEENISHRRMRRRRREVAV